MKVSTDMHILTIRQLYISMVKLLLPSSLSRLQACMPPEDKNFPTSHCAGWSPVQHNKRHRIRVFPGSNPATFPL